VVGGGHNGLTAAAYRARAGRSVLVLERRERLGGACTLERPFADDRYVVSPCAYAVGLLDEELLHGERTMIDVVFSASIADVLDEYMRDQRLKDALFGQGVIAAYGGPKDPGTASIKLMHYQGDLEGQGPVWGYVKGGMGMISFAIADAAREAGAQLATGTPVAEIVPEQGVRLEDGTFIRARTAICNADPKVALRLVTEMPEGYRARLTAWKVRSPVVKFNAALNALPEFTAATGAGWPARATIDVTGGLEAAQRAFEACERGEPAIGFGEIYIQTGYDPSPAPAGCHLLSVFGQYAPYELADGTWDTRRDEVARQFIDLIDRFAPGFEDRLEAYEVLGPPDIESRIGLTGGNIFQGEVMPDQMWEDRLTSRTPIPGVYLCGAATHPGGSVIALNGRNAAMAVLEDVRVTA
jgi:phytoene dehydrogenase-like protein